MTDTRTDLTPALTAEDWQDTSWGSGSVVVGLYEIQGRYTNEPRTHPGRIDIQSDENFMSLWEPKQYRALIALANHALPDTHPGKLTREMVDAIAGLKLDIRNMSDADLANVRLTQAALAALRALLPPTP